VGRRRGRRRLALEVDLAGDVEGAEGGAEATAVVGRRDDDDLVAGAGQGVGDGVDAGGVDPVVVGHENPHTPRVRVAQGPFREASGWFVRSRATVYSTAT